MPRAEYSAVCRIEYDQNDILQFSARETYAGQSISAIDFMKSEFTNVERANMEHQSQISQVEEAMLASISVFRVKLVIDLDYTESLEGNPQLTEAISRWHAWHAANEGGNAFKAPDRLPVRAGLTDCAVIHGRRSGDHACVDGQKLSRSSGRVHE
jgi:hypothetical protein